MNIGICANNRKDAQSYLELLIGEIKYKEVDYVIKNGGIWDQVKLKDGTYYRTFPANESSRGYRFDKVFVKKNVDKEILNRVIFPMIFSWDEKYPIIYFD